MAARRLHKKLDGENVYEKKIIDLLTESEMNIKNKINVFVLSKGIDMNKIDEIQKNIRRESGVFSCLEGSDNYTLIIQEKYSGLIKNRFDANIIRHNKELVLINFKSPKEIEEITGVISYLADLFAENGVNIVELFSCWTDTIFIIEAKNINKSIDFLKF